MDRLNEHKSRLVRGEIGRILWEVWDPLGVNDEAMMRDEYASYVGSVYELLVGGASDAAISRHLDETAENRMGMNRGATRSTLVALRSISLS